MPVPAAVVVNAAGLGSRLGLDAPKALLAVGGRPLIAWQLDLLRDVEDVRVVLGYRAAEVADVVFAARPDVTVVLNHDFASTGTAASLLRGATVAHARAVVSVDCDLVVHPDDLRTFLAADADVLGVVEVQSDEPVFVRTSGDGEGLHAREFDREYRDGDYEWSGLVRFDPSVPHLGPSRGHVFEMIANLLPMPARQIRAREVDYLDEVDAMAAWIDQLAAEGAFR